MNEYGYLYILKVIYKDKFLQQHQHVDLNSFKTLCNGPATCPGCTTLLILAPTSTTFQKMVKQKAYKWTDGKL